MGDNLSDLSTEQDHKSSSDDDQFLKNSLTQLSIGALAGMASRTGTAPLERLKILYQVQTHSKPPSVIQGIRNMYAESGLRGMWKGNGANLLKIGPESAVKLYTFEATKRWMRQWNKARYPDSTDPSATQLFICGSISGVAGHFVSFPLEVVKTRLAVATTGTYKGIVDCFTRTLKHEGIYSFYRGFTASMASTIPHSGINLMMYEVMKNFLVPADGKNSLATTLGLMVSGGTSAVFSQVVVYPVRTIKARMIMHNMPGFSTNQYLGMTAAENAIYSGGVLDVARATIKHEGVYGLYKGFYPSLLKTVPSNMIVFTVYGLLRNLFGIEKPQGTMTKSQNSK